MTGEREPLPDHHRKALEKHLPLCDAASKGNTFGNQLWRDAAAAIKWVLARDEAAD